jgi:protein-L-isoaspartate(D-aspartate) O-methyltransferase
MGRIPREAFVPASLKPLAYLDDDIQVKAANGGVPRFLMEPAPFARLLQLAEIVSTDSILDVGASVGYSTAVLAGLGARVIALESDAELVAAARGNLAALSVDNAKLVTGPLELGSASEGPFDVIVVEGSIEVMPSALLGQLREGGRLVAVIGYGRSGMATLYTRNDGQIGRRAAFNADVRPLPGFQKPRTFVF